MRKNDTWKLKSLLKGKKTIKISIGNKEEHKRKNREMQSKFDTKELQVTRG